MTIIAYLIATLAVILGLAIVLLLLRGAIQWVRHRQIYARWKRPKSYDRNLIVIGAGSAGLVSSYIAASAKAKVTLVEADKMGGDCLNYGCVPSKALIKSAKVADLMRHAEDYGLTRADPKVDFKAVMARVHAMIAEIEPHDSIERFTGVGVDVVQGVARIIDPWTVDIKAHDGTQQRLTTRSIMIAAGAHPIVPDIPGMADCGYLTSETLWEEFARRDAIPQRLLVLGGGPIGCELSQAFARLGAGVTLVQSGPRLLPKEDEDVSALAQSALASSGVNVLTGHRAIRVEPMADGSDQHRLITLSDGAEHEVPFDALIVAVGRRARMTGYGLEDLGIPTTSTVTTNVHLATIYPNIYAAGDVAGPYQFTHAASYQAWYATMNALFGQVWKTRVNYRVMPWTTFIDPEIARVGLNEMEAREQGIAYAVTTFPMHELDRAIVDGAKQGFVKVLTRPGKDQILGATIVSDQAGELLTEFVLAMKQGIGLNTLFSTVHSYPTMAEATVYAAGEWKQANLSPHVLAWAKRYHDWRRG